MFCLTLAPSDDLVNALLRNTKDLGNAGPGFTCFVTRDDFSVAVRFVRRVVGLWRIGKWRIVEHLEDMKRRQPDVEASCGVEAPCMIRTGQTHWPDLEEWDTLGDSGKRWAAGTVL